MLTLSTTDKKKQIDFGAFTQGVSSNRWSNRRIFWLKMVEKNAVRLIHAIRLNGIVIKDAIDEKLCY